MKTDNLQKAPSMEFNCPPICDTCHRIHRFNEPCPTWGLNKQQKRLRKLLTKIANFEEASVKAVENSKIKIK